MPIHLKSLNYGVFNFFSCSSCLSEYILVKFGGQTQKLCHSNVTTPIRVGDTEDAGHFDSYAPVTILVKWMGVLDIRTSYLGRLDIFYQY